VEGLDFCAPEPCLIKDPNFTAKLDGGDIAAEPPPADHRTHCFWRISELTP
jgi:hypothetical protein